MTIEWRQRIRGARMCHAFLDGVPMCSVQQAGAAFSLNRPFIATECVPVELSPFGKPYGKCCTRCSNAVLRATGAIPTRPRSPPPVAPCRSLVPPTPAAAYANMLRQQEKQGQRWFKIAFRLAIRAYPCGQCKFTLATHWMHDDAFGAGEPILCRGCTDGQLEWVPVDPQTAYDVTTQNIIEALGDEWLTPRVP